MLYPCDTCHHKSVCKYCEEMKDFIKELDAAVQEVTDRHKNIKTSDILRPNERICTRYSKEVHIRSVSESEDDFGTFRYPAKKDD